MIRDFPPHLLSMNQVVLLEDILAELLHRLLHLPSVVLPDFLLDEVDDGPELARFLPQVLHNPVNSFRQHLLVIQLHLQVRRKFQFVRQFPHDALEERVNRLHVETAVVVDNVL